MPVGRCVMRTAESVTLTCWPTGARRPVGVDAEVLLVDLDLGASLLEEGRPRRCEAKLWRRGWGVERGDADEPVHARARPGGPVGVAAPDDERGRRDAGLLAGRGLVELDVEAPALGPAEVHAQQHLGPVLGVGAPRRRRGPRRRRRARRARRRTATAARARRARSSATIAGSISALGDSSPSSRASSASVAASSRPLASESSRQVDV